MQVAELAGAAAPARDALVVELVRALDAVLARVDAGPDGPEAEALAVALGRVAGRAATGQARLLTAIEADGRWALGGHRSLTQWAAARLDLPVATARAQVRLGRALRDALPATARAATDGDLGAEAAHVLAALATTTPARRAILADPDHACNEGFLLARARALRVDDLRQVVRAWAHHADPDADDRGFVEASEREHLEVSRVPYGYRVDGQLTVEHGQQLRAALTTVMGQPPAGDQRSTAQRRAQGLADLARLALDHGLVGTGAAVRPQVTVLVDHPTLVGLVARCDAGTGEHTCADTLTRTSPAKTRPARFGPEDLDRGPRYLDGTAVPRPVLDRLACDGAWNRVIFGPTSEVLDVGRSARTFTGPRRAAVIARDAHCQHPGCTAPPALGEVHHVRHWVRDHGETRVADGVLLCWYHHDLVHRRGIEIARRPGGWAFSDRFGRPMRE